MARTRYPQDNLGPYILVHWANAKEEDRFSLWNDPTARGPELDNSIHPVFHVSNWPEVSPAVYENMKQALRLASMFLRYNSTLEFFASPLLGNTLIDSQSGKRYLSNPLSNKTQEQKAVALKQVRRGLQCLAHCVKFCFIPAQGGKFWGRTKLETGERPSHTSECPPFFSHDHSAKFEFRKHYLDYYQDRYASSPTHDQIRQDFSFATTVVHEVTHAVGVMRRGDYNEPCIRLDHPSPEHGYAWENFMFGGIHNPLDRISAQVGFFTRKPWAREEDVNQLGREWSCVPYSYIAQWFYKSTWELVKEHGPTAIPPPYVSLKLQTTPYYTVQSASLDALDDVSKAVRGLEHFYKHKYHPAMQKISPPGSTFHRTISTSQTGFVDSDSLQLSRFPETARLPVATPACGRMSVSAMRMSDPALRDQRLLSTCGVTSFPEWPNTDLSVTWGKIEPRVSNLRTSRQVPVGALARPTTLKRRAISNEPSESCEDHQLDKPRRKRLRSGSK